MNARNEMVQMIIQFYNMLTGCSLRKDSTTSTSIVSACLARNNDDVTKVKKHMREWVLNHANDGCGLMSERLAECLSSVGIEEKPVEAVAPAVVADPSEKQVSASLSILEQALVKVVAETSAQKIESEIMGQVKQTIADYIKSEYGTIERKIVTVVDGVKKDLKGVQHEKFETIMKFVANNEPVFLTGPAGSGKNVLCKQVAEALGLKFYFTNAVTQEYKLTGFTDAMGNYQPTQFYKAFTEGGVFMLDEMDASIPEVLIILNAAIANRYFDFPAPIGYVEAHPDFRVIAAGNTTGHGADIEYVGRNQLDAASLDRFAVVKIDYSETIENSVAGGDKELVEFCRAFRKVAVKSGLNVIVSYRAIGRLAKMLNLLTAEEAIETCLIKGLDKDDLNILLGNLSINGNKYRNAFEKVVAAA